MQALPQGSCRSVQELQVLLVDRDASLTTVLQMPLRKAGFSVSTARTAREAARILEEKRQDAVVLDPSLPDGEANELFERLGRASHASSVRPALVLISSLDDEDTTRRFGLTGDRFLDKPFDPWDLVRILQELLAPAVSRSRSGYPS